MAVKGFGSAPNALRRLSVVYDTYPFMVSVWYNTPTLATQGFLVQIGLSGQDLRTPGAVVVNTSNNVEAWVGSTTTWQTTNTSTTFGSNTWVHCTGEFISTTARAALLNGGGRQQNTTSLTPPASDSIKIGVQNTNANPLPSTAGVAEISIWGGSMTAADMNSLSSKLFNGGAGSVGGNPLNINAEVGQPWSGQLKAYWTLNDTTDLTDHSGNGNDLSIQGTLSNFGSHPTIEAVVTGDPVGSIRPRTTVSIVP